MPIKTYAVNSTNIIRAGHDPKSLELEIQFQNGTVYRYKGVPRGLYNGIFTSDSPGVFFRKNIIGGKFKFKKIKRDK